MSSNVLATAQKDVRATLSTLWIVVMLCMLAADILSSYIPGASEEVAEFAGDTPIPQLMLAGAVMMSIAILMILLSRLLPYRANRWANLIAAVVTIVYVIGGGSAHPHYIYLAGIEVLCMAFIAWLAWTWTEIGA